MGKSVVFPAMEIVLDKKCRAILLMQQLDSGFVEIDIGINDVRVVRSEPRTIRGSDRIIFTWNDKGGSSAPTVFAG
jgi:hypothetical protein